MCIRDRSWDKCEEAARTLGIDGWKRFTSTRYLQVGLVNMRACVEPVGTAIGAVCVEYGRPKWPITMLNHTHTWYRRMFCFFIFGTLFSYDPLTTNWKRLFSLKPRKKRLASLARFMKINYFTINSWLSGVSTSTPTHFRLGRLSCSQEKSCFSLDIQLQEINSEIREKSYFRLVPHLLSRGTTEVDFSLV